jgi:indole-3-glycerol phosphate synthase
MTEQGPNNDTRRLTETQGGTATGAKPRGDVLARIVETKRTEVQTLRGREAELRARAGDAAPARPFAAALGEAGTVSLVAEVKRRSPGAGAIALGLDPVARARAYHEGGARALSVLTDRTWFQGSLDDLVGVRDAVPLPVLRKDFTIDERQVWEARAAGADAVLLIVRILDDRRLEELRLLAEDLGMAALVEAHDEEEVGRAVASGARILGINNRDLRTFTTRIEVTLALVRHVPPGVTLVSESGISGRSQVERLAAEGVDAILVGEALVRAGDPVAAARSLGGVPLQGGRGEGA